MRNKISRLFSVLLVFVTLVMLFAINSSAASYYMECTIYYKDESGTQIAPTRTFTVNAAETAGHNNPYASPEVDGYSLKNSSDSYVTYSMMDKTFPPSQYVREGTATYTVYYVKNQSTTIYYKFSDGSQAYPSKTVSGNPNSDFWVGSPSVEGHYASKSSCTGKYGSASQTVYYYELTYSVKFDVNGGTGSISSQTKRYFSDLKLTSAVPSRTGYVFKGWGTSSTDTNPDFQPGGTYYHNMNMTLYAVWEKATYIISYDANGGNGAPESQIKTHGEDITLSSAIPQRYNHVFMGWSLSPSSSSIAYNPGDNYTAEEPITLYAVWLERNYDLSVSGLKIEPGEVYQYETVTVSFRTDNWDRNFGYSNVPVEVLMNGSVIYSTRISFSKYGVQNFSMDVNVGSGVGSQTVTVRINWSSRSNEKDSTDKSVAATFNVKKIVETSVQPIKPNGDYIEGMEVITSYYVSNELLSDILPSDRIAFDFTVYKITDSGTTVIENQILESIVIPSGGRNLVCFKWRIPVNSEGETYFCQGTVNVYDKEYESDSDNNVREFAVMIKSMVESQTENTRYEESAPQGYNPNAPVPTEKFGSAVWNMWVYESGELVLKNYGVSISTDKPLISPSAECKSAVASKDALTIRSGYGIDMSWNPTVIAKDGYNMPSSDEYTSPQLVYATFPEYAHSDENGKFRTLEHVNGTYRFVENNDSPDRERLHFIPIYVKDGAYIISATATHIWTPAGMIRAVVNTDSITVSGTLYDDFYVGEQ